MAAIINGPHDAFLCQAFSALRETILRRSCPKKPPDFANARKFRAAFQAILWMLLTDELSEPVGYVMSFQLAGLRLDVLP